MNTQAETLKLFKVSQDHGEENYRIVVQFDDPDNVLHTLVISQQHFKGKAKHQ